MPTKEQKAVGRMLAAKLLDDHVSGDDPDCFSANEAFKLVRVYPELRLIRVSTPANAND